MSRVSNPLKVAQWSDRLDRFEESNQTVRAFCVAEGVSTPSFYQWKKRLSVGGRVRGGRSKRIGVADGGKSPNRGSENKSAFQQIQLTPTSGRQQSTTIRLADGVEIELGSDLQVVDAVVRCVIEQVLPDRTVRAGGTPC